MIQSITFGDKNTYDDWHLLPVERPVVSPPPVKEKYVEVPGGNTLDLTQTTSKYLLYNNRTGSFTFRVLNDHGPWPQRYSEILNHLQGKSMHMILMDDPEWYYQGRYHVETWENGETWSMITFYYDVEPYKLSVSNPYEPWEWNPFNFNTGIMMDVFSVISTSYPDDTIIKIPGSLIKAPTSIQLSFCASEFENSFIRFENRYLGIVEQERLKNGPNDFPNMILYGQDEYTITISGPGTLFNLYFRVGRL